MAGNNASSLCQYRGPDYIKCSYQRNNVHEHYREVICLVGLSDLCGRQSAYASKGI